MISLHAQAFKDEAARTHNLVLNCQHLLGIQSTPWELGINWKSALNNLRLIIQPYIFWCLIEPWLQVFSRIETMLL